MEVGKKYKGSFGYEFKCVALTPQGNAIFLNSKGEELLCSREHFAQYTEVVEPIVRYLHWYRNKRNEILCSTTFLPEIPKFARADNLAGYTHLKVERIEYRG